MWAAVGVGAYLLGKELWDEAQNTGANAKAKSQADDATREKARIDSAEAKAAFNDTSQNDALRADIDKRLGALGGRTAPQVKGRMIQPMALHAKGAQIGPMSQYGGPNATNANASRAEQHWLLQQLRDQSMGNGPSVATAQMKSNVDASLSAIASANAAGRARTPGALGARATLNAGAGAMQAGARDSAMLRTQEQLAARQQFAGLAGQIRDQDMGTMGMEQQTGLTNMAAVNAARMAQAGFDQSTGQFNAGQSNDMTKFTLDMDQRRQLANMEAELRARGMDDQMIAQYVGMRADTMRQDKTDKMAFWGYQSGNDQKNADRAYMMNRDASARSAARDAATGQMLGYVAMMSDERAKKNVRPGGPALSKLFAELDAHEYEYTDTSMPGTAPGKRVSPMAQELEKSSLTREAVVDSPDGYKRVDYAKLGGVTFAGLIDAHKRLAKLEAKASR